MEDRDALIEAMASVRKDVRKRTDAAIAAILTLVWPYRGEGFSFEAHEEIDAEVNRILAALSDGNLADAEARAIRLLEDAGLEEYGEEAIGYAEREREGEDARFRLDMHASHLKELLAGWLAVAGLAGLTQSQVVRNVYSYLGNPVASKEWREAGLGAPHWGTGYARNVLNGMTVIVQDLINTAYQKAVLDHYAELGAVGYVIHRGSSYDCPFCDSHCGIVYSFDDMRVPQHPRCVCYTEPVFKDE